MKEYLSIRSIWIIFQILGNVCEDIWFENTGEWLTTPIRLPFGIPRQPLLLKKAIEKSLSMEEPKTLMFWL